VPVLGYFLFAELLTVTFGGETAALEIFTEMLWGHFAPLFWVNLIVGLLLPLLLLVMPARLSAAWAFARAAAATAFAGVLAMVWPWAGGDAQTLFAESFPAWGALAQPAWMLGILVLLIVVLTVIVPSTSVFVRVGTASALIVVGVLLERTNIVVLPQLHRYLMEFYGEGRYVPTWPEVSVTLGIYALGALAFLVLAKLFPLVELPDESA